MEGSIARRSIRGRRILSSGSCPVLIRLRLLLLGTPGNFAQSTSSLRFERFIGWSFDALELVCRRAGCQSNIGKNKSRMALCSDSTRLQPGPQLLKPDVAELASQSLAAEWSVAVGFQLVMNGMRSGGSAQKMWTVMLMGTGIP